MARSCVTGFSGQCRSSRSTTFRIAFGHLPLLDDVSLQIEPRERVSIIGRNGTGKSTLLQIISGELHPDAGTVWRQPGAAHRTAGAGHSADCARAGRRRRRRRAGGRHGARRGLAARAQSRSDPVAARPRRATHRRHAVRRLEAARAAGAGAGGRADVLLLDEPTNHLDIEAITLARELPADYPGAVVFVTHDRAFLQRLATRIVEIDRGRLTSWPGDYATFLRKKEEWLANEAIQQRQVRQAPGAGGGLAAPGHQGAAHPRRGPRPRADGDARRTRGSAARCIGRGATAGRSRPTRPGSWSSRPSSVNKSYGDRVRRARLLDARPARRSRRPDRPERRRQDDAAAAAARRARARYAATCARRQRADCLLRPAARAARPGTHRLRHRWRRQRHGRPSTASRATCTAICRISFFRPSAPDRR